MTRTHHLIMAKQRQNLDKLPFPSFQNAPTYATHRHPPTPTAVCTVYDCKHNTCTRRLKMRHSSFQARSSTSSIWWRLPPILSPAHNSQPQASPYAPSARHQQICCTEGRRSFPEAFLFHSPPRSIFASLISNTQITFLSKQTSRGQTPYLRGPLQPAGLRRRDLLRSALLSDYLRFLIHICFRVQLLAGSVLTVAIFYAKKFAVAFLGGFLISQF